MIVIDIDFLRTKSEPVSSVQEAKEILLKLEEEMKKHETSIGLSAIQIGIPKQVSIVKTNAGKFSIINPVVVEEDNKFVFFGEGCISFPGEYINTERYFQITIDNQVIEDDSFRTERQVYHTDDPQKEVTAIAVQHEIDHQNGIIFRDRESISVPIKAPAKIGRNEPCPCGSGKKYKKCCYK